MGAAPPQRVIINQWDSVKQAQAFYKSKAYNDLVPQRDKAIRISHLSGRNREIGHLVVLSRCSTEHRIKNNITQQARSGPLRLSLPLGKRHRARQRIIFLHCINLRCQSNEMGHEPPRRSLAAVTGLNPIPAAPSRAWGRCSQRDGQTFSKSCRRKDVEECLALARRAREFWARMRTQTDIGPGRLKCR